MEKRQKLILFGAIAVVVTASILMMRKAGATTKEIKETEPEDDIIKDDSGSGSGSGSGSTVSTGYPDTPFKSKEEGDKFRTWIRKTYPSEAAAMSGGGVDATGSENSPTLREAYAKYYRHYLSYLTSIGAVSTANQLSNQTQTNLQNSGNFKEVVKVTPRKEFPSVTVRMTPSINSTEIGKLSRGKRLDWISQKTYNDGRAWHYVKFNDNVNGYVLATAVDKVKTYPSIV